MGRFKPGESGNPQGRKLGTKTAAGKLRDQLLTQAPEILAALIEQAKIGDPAAAKLVLDRCLPALRPTDAPVAMTLPADTADLGAASQAVLLALGAGSITPDQAGSIAGVLNALARVRETTELEQRIIALEGKQ